MSSKQDKQTREPRVPVLPPSIALRGNWFSRIIGKTGFWLTGWRIKGNFPDVPKIVAVVSPHTSNWDFPIGVGILSSTGLRVWVMAKHTLFKWPLVGGYMRFIGLFPVDRRAAHGAVGEAVAQFEKVDKLTLVIAPEGTRSKVTRWKNGFYHIAVKANVPIVPVAFDYGQKAVVVFDPFYPTGDLEADLPKIQAYFKGVRGKNPEQGYPLF